jgi:hypothetical protein
MHTRRSARLRHQNKRPHQSDIDSEDSGTCTPRKKRETTAPALDLNPLQDPLVPLPDYVAEELDGTPLTLFIAYIIILTELFGSCSAVLRKIVCIVFAWPGVCVDRLKSSTSSGKAAATSGHYYSHPSNHFWYCLHHSGAYFCLSHCTKLRGNIGFTPSLLDASKDFMLPGAFNLGLVSYVILYLYSPVLTSPSRSTW